MEFILVQAALHLTNVVTIFPCYILLSLKIHIVYNMDRCNSDP
jgi:hypothetical protein